MSAHPQPFRLAIAGLGTVATGLIKILTQNADLITQHAGRPVVVTDVSAKQKNKSRAVDISAYQWWDDAAKMARDADVDMVVELVGGDSGIAPKICQAALENNKHLLTANKALLARHGMKFAKLAEERGLAIKFEAAAAGGIPIIKNLREAFVANNLTRVAGIINGTCNFILSSMQRHRHSFRHALEEATRLGYAEKDPTLDIDGTDAAHKLSLLSALAFHHEISFDQVYVEGIRGLELKDFDYAEYLGYRIKQMAIASKKPQGVAQYVYPCLIPMSSPLAYIDDGVNAALVDGDFIGRAMITGPGAGGNETASGLAGDIIDHLRFGVTPVFGRPIATLQKPSFAGIQDRFGSYYVRTKVHNKPGVLAEVTSILARHDISMDAMVHRGTSFDQADLNQNVTSIVFTTEDTVEHVLRQALDEIAKLHAVIDRPSFLRIEKL